MVLRKQTVWLLTMLAVMVVLSGYYLVKGPNQQIPALGEDKKQEAPIGGVDVESKQTDKPSPDATPVEGTTSAADGKTTDADGTSQDKSPEVVADSASDYFQGYKMKRDAMMQQQKDEQMAIMMNPEASPQAIADAKAKHEELSNIEQSTLSLEELLKAKGYKDAVVNVQNGSVNVIVEKDKLDAKEVVDIIALVKQQLNVSGSNVIVSFHK